MMAPRGGLFSLCSVDGMAGVHDQLTITDCFMYTSNINFLVRSSRTRRSACLVFLFDLANMNIVIHIVVVRHSQQERVTVEWPGVDNNWGQQTNRPGEDGEEGQ